MDFKVAGNEHGISTFQLDIKSEGLTINTLKRALYQAKRARLHVLDRMKAHLSTPRPLKGNIPRILEISVAPETLGKIIGPKGKTIQSLIETFGLKNINIEDDGSVQIESFSSEKNEEAKIAILKIVEEASKPKPSGRGGGGGGGGAAGADGPPPGPPPETGEVYKDCEIKGIHDFGVFVEVLPGHEGLVHVSELDVKKIPDPTSAGYVVGQKIDVKCLGFNNRGQLRFSRRAVLMRESGSNSGSVLTSQTMIDATQAAAAAAGGGEVSRPPPAGPLPYRRRQPIESSVPSNPTPSQ
jgi:polyribonucleotide nucleotidyltransferase